MGQVALGFRSLLTKAAIFFVMAALLAWALGGTLWPRAVVVDSPAISAGGGEWWWRMAVGGGEGGGPRWTMMVRPSNGRAAPFEMFGEAPMVYSEAAGPVTVAGTLDVAFAGLPADERPACSKKGWCLFIASASASDASCRLVPDRLAAEQQLARLAAGLPLQDYETILRQRSAVIDPADE